MMILMVYLLYLALRDLGEWQSQTQVRYSEGIYFGVRLRVLDQNAVLCEFIEITWAQGEIGRRQA